MADLGLEWEREEGMEGVREGKGPSKFRWENYEISGSVEIYLSTLNRWL